MFDYIVVGAGAAGCVLANRLSANPANRVLLLEAGGPDTRQEVRIPAAFTKLFKSEQDWNYTAAADPARGTPAQFWPRGKMLGGSSSMNAMMYVRGHRSDYDGWREQGNPGWGYDDVLPYFRRSEQYAGGASEFRGANGPLHVGGLRSPNPLTNVFLAACDQRGLARNPDYNGAKQDGFAPTQVTQKRGRRWSAADAFLRPALRRPNLTVQTGAHTTRVLFEQHVAVGVEYRRNNEIVQAYAEHEVVLCGGAINSPQLLLLSGVGPAGRLRELGIPLVHDLPGVGQNLHDHPLFCVTYQCTQPISLAGAESLKNIAAYLLRGRGMLTSNVGEAVAFVRTHADLPAPDVELIFAPAFFMEHGYANPASHGFSIGVVALRPASRGALTLASADPFAAPRIEPRYFADERDMDTMLAGVKLARAVAGAAAFAPFRGDEVWPGRTIQSDADLRDAIRQRFQSIYHPAGTCKMGNDLLAVVDAELRVQGVERLRVADASVMPSLNAGHPQAPTLMIAERAADMLAGVGVAQTKLAAMV